MKTLILAAAAALCAAAAPTLVMAQTPPTALQVEIPELARVTADPTCGGKAALQQQHVFCVTTTQAGVSDAVDAYSAAFQEQGWLAAGGDDNLIIYVKRKPDGGCDGFQMLAFADDTRVPAPGGPAWLAFAAIPGNVCAASPAPARPMSGPPAPGQ